MLDYQRPKRRMVGDVGQQAAAHFNDLLCTTAKFRCIVLQGFSIAVPHLSPNDLPCTGGGVA